MRWKFSVVTGCTAGWILPSIPCFLNAVHTHNLAHASVLHSPARNAVGPWGNGRNELSFHARFSNMLPRSSFCHWKKCLTVTNHSDSWGTSRKICYRRRQCYHTLSCEHLLFHFAILHSKQVSTVWYFRYNVMFWNPLNILSIYWILSYSFSQVLLGKHAETYMKKKVTFCSYSLPNSLHISRS